MPTNVLAFLYYCICIVLLVDVSAEVHQIAASDPDKTEVLKVWIYFKDKPTNGLSKTTFAKHTLERRLFAGYHDKQQEDTPVFSEYIDAIKEHGGVFHHSFKWNNAASFELPVQVIPQIKALPYVKEVTLVGKTIEKSSSVLQKRLQKKKIVNSDSIYGNLYSDLLRLRVPQAHRYLKYIRPDKAPGTDVTVALLDNGFRLDHRCFKHLLERHAIIASHDFVENDTDVSTSDVHGTYVLGILAAYDPPYYCGTAWGVNLLLAKTESDDYESHSEEDNWAAAVVWAEELGVDIISSSLGYRDFDYNDTVIINRGNGNFDTVESYSKADLDGKTTIISRAAAGAVQRGVIVVNAVGNEQQEWGDTSLSAPADVDGVVAVGALNDKNLITVYSSLGPTGDGRIKPDLVAPGDVNVPNIYSINNTDYRSKTSGTSLATPFVAGIFSMVKQLHPSLTSDALRQRVYRFCRFLAVQDTIDNVYGHGIPDAARSCIQNDDEVFVVALDTGRTPLAGAIIRSSTGTTVTSTDTNGIAYFTPSAGKATALSISRWNKSRTFVIDSTPSFIELRPCSLIVQVSDKTSSAVINASIHCKIDGAEIIKYTDSLGMAVIANFFPGTVQIYAAKPGYYHSDTLSMAQHEITETKKVTIAVYESGFEVYPTVVRRSHGQKLMVRFACQQSSTVAADKFLNAAIRSVNGTLIWKNRLSTDGSPTILCWDSSSPNGNHVAPGIYFLTLSFNGKAYRQKFIIAE
jgi:serine protease AprX